MRRVQPQVGRAPISRSYMIGVKCLQRSVLILGECERQRGRAVFIVFGSYSIIVVAFFRSHVYQPIMILFSLRDAFSRIRPQGEWAPFIFCCVMMVLIDRASKELSIAWHIVDFDDFGPILWKSGFGGGFQAVGGFLDPFLTGSIGKRSSNQADYTPNR